jgi:ABC-2 type transport system permease protein
LRNAMGSWTLLLYPKTRALSHRFSEKSAGSRLKWAFLLALALGFWVFTFFIFQKVLVYFRSIELFGDLLNSRLLSMMLLTFFSILLFSNLISSLSTFFLSEDLTLILCRPVPQEQLYYARLAETLGYTSWMVVLFAFPVFLAYGWVYGASWKFYGNLLAALIPFLFIPAALGTMLAMFLVNVFPARRTKDILLLLSILLAAGLYFLIRFLQPEKLTNPDSFAGLVEYMTALAAPSWPFLPSFWFAESVTPYLQDTASHAVFYQACLWSTAGAMGVVGSWVSGALFYSGWTKSQEGRKAYLTRIPLFNQLLRAASRPLRPQTRALVIKDGKTFFRDTTQWSQLILLAALVVVYLYNFSVLPLDQTPMPSFFLQNLFSFLNLGLAGFVLSAVAGRFVFPGVSQEGFSFWIIRSSPLSLRTFLWSKFWTGLFPLLLLAEALIFLSNWLLKVTPFMMAVSSLTILFITCGVVGLAVGLGALYPRFTLENTARMAWGMGGAIYMIISMIFIGGVVLLEAWPVYAIFMAKFHHRAVSDLQWAGIVASLAGMAFLIGLATLLPMRLGLKKLREMDF